MCEKEKWFYYLLIFLSNSKSWPMGVSISFLHPFIFSRAALVPMNITILDSYHISNRKLKMEKFVFSLHLKKLQINFMPFVKLVFIWLNNIIALKRSSNKRYKKEDSLLVDNDLERLLFWASHRWCWVIW